MMGAVNSLKEVFAMAHRRISLMPKMLILTLAIGATVWFLVDRFQIERIRNMFTAQVIENLKQQAEGDRFIFNNYLRRQRLAAKIFTRQSNFNNYIADKLKSGTWAEEGFIQVKHYDQIPPWFPEREVLRWFGGFRYALLLDKEGEVREVFQNWYDPLTKSLLKPSGILQDLSHNQSYMTEIGGVPFFITSETVYDSTDQPRVTLMLASQLDSEFLILSRGLNLNKNIIVLISDDHKKLLASSQPDLLPAGNVDGRMDNYFIAGNSFFDYGSSDLLVHFASLKSKDEIEGLVRSEIAQSRRQLAITAIALILSFTIITVWIVRHIRDFTLSLTNFSEQVLGGKKSIPPKGDELIALKEQFHKLTKGIRTSNEALVISEGKYRSLFESSNDAIYISTNDGKFADINPSTANLFGYTKDEMVGMDVHNIYADPACRRKFQEEIEKDGFVKNYEIPLKKKGGARLDCLITATVRKDANGSILGYQGIIRDVTKDKILQQRLIRADKMKSLGTLVSGVAHEINNPNNHILMNSEMLAEILESLKPTLEEYYKKGDSRVFGALSYDEFRDVLPKIISGITEGSKRINRIVGKLKSFSRQDAGSPKQTLDIHDVIASALFLVDRLSIKSTTKLKSEYAPNLPKIKANFQELEQVFMNISLNAYQAIAKAKSKGTLKVKTKRDGDKVVVTLENDGPPIPEDKINMIFDPFFTTKDAGEGTGLGLSVSFGIIKDHGGDIFVENIGKSGVRFAVTLPALTG